MAECMYKKGENTEKFNYVFDKIYKLLPDGLKIYVSKDAVKTFIQNIFNKIKVTLDANTGEFANGETVIELKINVLKTLDKTILERELNNILEQSFIKNSYSFVFSKSIVS